MSLNGALRSKLQLKLSIKIFQASSGSSDSRQRDQSQVAMVLAYATSEKFLYDLALSQGFYSLRIRSLGSTISYPQDQVHWIHGSLTLSLLLKHSELSSHRLNHQMLLKVYAHIRNSSTILGGGRGGAQLPRSHLSSLQVMGDCQGIMDDWALRGLFWTGRKTMQNFC